MAASPLPPRQTYLPSVHIVVADKAGAEALHGVLLQLRELAAQQQGRRLSHLSLVSVVWR